MTGRMRDPWNPHDFYTKSEIDSLLATYYTQSQVNTALAAINAEISALQNVQSIGALILYQGVIAFTNSPLIAGVTRESNGVYLVSFTAPVGSYAITATPVSTPAFARYAEAIGVDHTSFRVTTIDGLTGNPSDTSFWIELVRGTQEPILWAGDSEIVGLFLAPGDSQGGSRVNATAILRNGGHNVAPVGPTIDYGYHRGVGAETAQTVATGGLATWSALITDLQPRVALMAWGVNDMGAGRSLGQIQADLATILAAGKAASPDTSWCIESIIVPDAAAAGGYGANRAVAIAFNAAGPAWAGALGATWIDRGSPNLGADFIHPAAQSDYNAIGAIEAPFIAGLL